MVPFLPLLPAPAGQEGHPASHASRTFEESDPQTGGILCARARLLRLSWWIQVLRSSIAASRRRKPGLETCGRLRVRSC